MSRVSDAAERVEEFLRQRATMSGLDETVAGANGHELLRDDLSLLVECAQWLLMASSAELKREYATTTEEQGLVGTHLRPAELEKAQDDVDGWNRAARADEAFVATRLVSPWERHA